MKTDVFDEALAGLRSVLKDAERRKDPYLNVRSANRFLRRLPGAWRGKWWHLHINGGSTGSTDREDFLTELRATIAYLEAYTAKLPKAEPGASSSPRLQAPIDADFAEVKPQRSKRLKVIK